MKIRSAETIRVIQTTAGAAQVFMGFAGVSDTLSKTAVIFIMAGIGAVQAWIAIWNAGLHNQPDKPYEPTPYVKP